ncbi:unnamed protein product [Phyllotreta striolata]|uniref:Peptidase M14 domain-containing protein n=1 Tax=Phyllotreta striolata TaxID=444603 RepID=A0A9N9TU82_PHYSR|nr:unnamed protein product [Phyllotreta striolata]
MTLCNVVDVPRRLEEPAPCTVGPPNGSKRVYKVGHRRAAGHTAMVRAVLLLVAVELAAGIVAASTRISYDGNQLWRIFLEDAEDKKVIVDLKKEGWISTWGGNATNLDVIVKPEAIQKVQEAFKNEDIKFEIVIRNLQEAIDAENPPVADDNEDRSGFRLNWVAYHRTTVIWDFLEYFAKVYPSLCTVYNIGQSYEGRPIKVLKISNGNPTNKPVWIDGGIHAREWISPAAVTYIINHLVAKFEEESDYIQNTDFYVAPVLNPDGYEYSHSSDRLWRKNRRPQQPDLVTGRVCYGIDLNRNFGYKWGYDGVSHNSCHDTFCGKGPFSEPETRVMRDFIKGNLSQTLDRLPKKLAAYVSFHSYGQYILYPWGYMKVVPPDYLDLKLAADQAVEAIVRVGGPRYTAGSSAVTLYPAAGGSDDWAKAAIGAKYSYTIELGDNGRYGFLLPSKLIKQTSKEALAALRVIVEAAYLKA